MPPRPSFKGYIRLSLISVPVRAYTATESGGQISLNQLHAECNTRVKYSKVCPVHGELSSDEIVSGYEYAKGQYVVIDPDELAKIRKQSDKALEIRGFIKQEELDARYFSGRTYYLLPDGPVGEKAYHLLWKAMEDHELYAVISAILHNKEQLAVIRPVDKLLGISVLSYARQVRQPDEFEEELTEPKFSPEEMKLTEMLVNASVIEDFDIAAYTDEYTENLLKLIEAKVEGQEIVAAPEVEEPKIINLMDALKASVEQARSAGTGAAAETAAAGEKTKTAPSARSRTQGRQKKTG
jgi:DNA end-binding protein Ku